MKFPAFARHGRYSVYGLVVGMLIGVPMGIWMSTSESMLPPWYKRWLGDPDRLERRIAGGSRNMVSEEGFNLEALSISPAEVRSGGPGKDGIPAITNPVTVPASEARFIEPDDRLVSVAIGDEVRAYPIRLLNWHEIVNDTVGEAPIAVVYCPLCDSVTVVDRLVGGETLDFGVSGLLYRSNVLMYDRTTLGLWSQILMECVSGPHVGHVLGHLPWEITTFGEWRSRHPAGSVVSFDTGHVRQYDRNPYVQYLETDQMLFAPERIDARLPLKERIVGVRFDDDTIAIPVADVLGSASGTFTLPFGGERVVLQGDAVTGSVRVVEVPEGASVIHTFWYAWAWAHPDTVIFRTP